MSFFPLRLPLNPARPGNPESPCCPISPGNPIGPPAPLSPLGPGNPILSKKE